MIKRGSVLQRDIIVVYIILLTSISNLIYVRDKYVYVLWIQGIPCIAISSYVMAL